MCNLAQQIMHARFREPLTPMCILNIIVILTCDEFFSIGAVDRCKFTDSRYLRFTLCKSENSSAMSPKWDFSQLPNIRWTIS